MPEAPAPAQGLWNRLRGHIVRLAHKLLDIKDRPHAIAGGVAIGMFIGFTPLFGIKTLLCLGLAFALRCNPIAAVIAVSLHDIVTPFWPFLLILEYRIGQTVLGHSGEADVFSGHHFHLMELLQWTTFLDVGLPLLVGSLFLAIPAAAAAYWITLPILERRRKAKAP